MPGKCTTDALFALGVLMEKYREDQKELHRVFVYLEKAYDKVSREEVSHEKVRENSTIYVWSQYNCTEVCGTVAKGGYDVTVWPNVVIGPNVVITYMDRRINS